MLLLPLFLIVALAIKIDSRGPVFFVQKRIGRGGKLFRCVKFRTMTTDANHEVAGYEYAEVTSYITRVGHFLRKTSIDELPPHIFDEIMHFFSVYKQLENKQTAVKTLGGKEEAIRIIIEAIEGYNRDFT